MFDLMEDAGLDTLHFACDQDTGMRAIIAIHSTARGPAIGGCRFISYPNDSAAIDDAIRLARGMSYKAALAGLPHGGGKAVILRPEGNFDRGRLMRSFGHFVNGLDGRYITAMDAGTQTTDMDAIAHQTPWVTCTSQAGDPSPATAEGVFEGIKAALRHRYGHDQLKGIRVALQGLGHVGYHLAQLLNQAGATLWVADIDANKVAHAVATLGATAVPADRIYSTPAEIFCPCGLGGVINDHTLPLLLCDIVAGSANNQLAREEHGDLLRRRGILYAPDYLINAGGLIFVALQYAGNDPGAIRNKIRQIGPTLQRLFAQADREGLSTHQIANRQAETMIANAALHPAA